MRRFDVFATYDDMHLAALGVESEGNPEGKVGGCGALGQIAG